jgi:hypothetical protein
MARKKNRRVRSFSEISTYRELREVRTRLDMKLWYAEQRLSDRLVRAFSAENLLSLIAPPGSLIDNIIVGIGKGMATVRGVLNAIDYFRGRH